MREGRGSECYTSYINANLKDKEVGNLGKVFNRWWDSSCFGGAYASWLGSGAPTFMVASQITVSDTDSDVGLFVHEFLHNLGVGHTQKRPGIDENLESLGLIIKYCLTVLRLWCASHFVV